MRSVIGPCAGMGGTAARRLEVLSRRLSRPRETSGTVLCCAPRNECWSARNASFVYPGARVHELDGSRGGDALAPRAGDQASPSGRSNGIVVRGDASCPDARTFARMVGERAPSIEVTIVEADRADV